MLVKLLLLRHTNATCVIFNSVVHLNRHERNHASGKKIECDLCVRGFSHQSRLTRHMVKHMVKHMVASGEKKFQCDKCNETVFLQEYLNKHMEEVHGEQQQFICDQCGTSFKKDWHMVEHIRSQTYVGIKPYQCSTCDKLFLKESQLNTHMHTGSMEFQCNQCGKSFSTNSAC